MSAQPGRVVPLTSVPNGVPVRIVSIDRAARGELAREGLAPGATVAVEARGPAGGPLVVALGRARVALSAEVAERIVTAPAGETPGP